MKQASADLPRVAFYAPMKSPNHPTPSGDRQIARLTLKALGAAGFDPVLVSEFRSLDMAGDVTEQAALIANAATERAQLLSTLRASPPALWFTYHCYYKAPDLLGPEIARELDIPYVISEPSISAKRRTGPWAGFTEISEAAIAAADHLFWTTRRDRTALLDAGFERKMTHLPAFVDAPIDEPERNAPHRPLRLLTVAMMRAGDKVESYRRLAASLLHVEPDWRLTIVGDGSERREVEALFAPFPDRVTFAGQVDRPNVLDRMFRDADIFVWPGVGEGVGMVYLEAQARGLPVVAEDHPAPGELSAAPCPPASDPQAFAARIMALAEQPAYSAAAQEARDHVRTKHSLETAASILGNTLHKLAA